MSTSASQPLASLSPLPAKDMGLGATMDTGRGGLAWFVLLTLFVGFVLYCLAPKFIQKEGATTVDNGKLLFWSLIIAVVLILLGWLLSMAQRKQ
jgi:hypothetical protein